MRSATEKERVMQTRRTKSALLAGSLTSIAAAIAMTAAAPTPVAAAGTMQSNSMEKHQSMHHAKKKSSGKMASNPCGPGRGSASSSPYASNPCGPASNSGR
jgi:hypothetical protein